MAATELDVLAEGAAAGSSRAPASSGGPPPCACSAWGLLPAFWVVVAFVILAPCACFLALAVSPRLFDQGTQWFTLSYLHGAFTGETAVALTNSIWVSCAAAGLGVAIGGPIAWAVARTRLPGRRAVAGSMWLILLMPSWIPALGWVRLFQAHGVLDRIGVGSSFETNLVLGPFGVVLLLGLRSVPFAFLAVSAALAGLGQEFEDAARVHGATRLQTRQGADADPRAGDLVGARDRLRGVGQRLRDRGDARLQLPLLARHLPALRGDQQLPAQLPGGRGDGLAARRLRGAAARPPGARAARPLLRRPLRPDAPGAPPRPVPRRQAPLRRRRGRLLRRRPARARSSASSAPRCSGTTARSFSVSLANYRAVFHSVDLLGPLERSLSYGAITATITVVAGFVAARLLTRVKSRAVRLLDFLLLAAVALPSVVFAAGYILAYNLPILSRLGIDLYQTTTLLIIGYAASSLPTNARVLVGAVSQLQASLHEAARTHGAGPLLAWARGVLPLVSRPLVFAWLLTFTGVFLELPISQLLYAPSAPPISVSIENDNTYHFGVGMAQATIALVCALGVVAAVLGGYRLLAPRGWRRVGEAVDA